MLITAVYMKTLTSLMFADEELDGHGIKCLAAVLNENRVKKTRFRFYFSDERLLGFTKP